MSLEDHAPLRETHLLFFFSSLPCDSFPSANIIPGSAAHAHDNPILVPQAAFRAEREREKEKGGRGSRPNTAHFRPRNASQRSGAAAARGRDMVSSTAGSGAAPPGSHRRLFVLAAALEPH